MKNYALIENGTVVNVVMWDGNAASWAPGAKQIAVAIPDGTSAGIGYMYSDGAFAPPVAAAPTAGDMWTAQQAMAQAALDASDMTAIRCLKAGVTFPVAWLNYCKALRAVVASPTGDPDAPLPAKPPYPSGT